MTARQVLAIYAQAYAETLCRETSIRLAAAWAEWPVASVREVVA